MQPGKKYQKPGLSDNSQSACNKLLENFCDSVQDAVLVYDDIGRIRAVNAAGLVMFGYREKDLLYKQTKLILPAIDEVNENGDFLNHMTTGVNSDGMKFPLDITITGFEGEDGSIYYFAIIRNMNNSSHVEAELSPRQQQVLKLVVEGHTSREIASKLMISVKTVETHRANIMTKLGVQNVSSLVRIVMEQDIL